jgi:arginyl-tRNA--protein-N-Asp/Glu arginylyltransferase
MPKPTLAYDDFELEFYEQVKESYLDDCLSKAWFRMGAFMISCAAVSIDNMPSNAYWLRYNIAAIELSKSSKKILAKNKKFDIEIKAYKPTRALKHLYQKYYLDRDFDLYDKLEATTDDPNRRIFDTYVIIIKDQNKIIAAGIFDIGQESVAAIRNFYDPEYAKYSLGKYLILVLYQYCLQRNIKWLYPGYITTRYTKFDYKLFLDPKATEMFLYESKLWVAYQQEQIQ